MQMSSNMTADNGTTRKFRNNGAGDSFARAENEIGQRSSLCSSSASSLRVDIQSQIQLLYGMVLVWPACLFDSIAKTKTKLLKGLVVGWKDDERVTKSQKFVCAPFSLCDFEGLAQVTSDWELTDRL